MSLEFENPIYVVKPTMPSLPDFTAVLEEIWEREIYTNDGPILRVLENEIDRYLGTNSTVLVSNGTMALQFAIRALELRDCEIITTPFTFLATSSSILWEYCTPVFVDIDEYTLNIDPTLIEDAITHKTKAILPVHVFGNPCDTKSIAKIASKNNLSVIYDAAHAFGVKHKGKSIFDYGDISVTSLHATKLFNTIEGGAIFTLNPDLKATVKSERFFGHRYENNRLKITDIGTNGKLSELHAAIGLLNLRNIKTIMKCRRNNYNAYEEFLGDVDWIRFQEYKKNEYNYSYVAVIFDTADRCTEVLERLESCNVFARRYFYPSLNTIKPIKQYTPCPISEDISHRILCLPTYTGMEKSTIEQICKIIKQ